MYVFGAPTSESFWSPSPSQLSPLHAFSVDDMVGAVSMLRHDVVALTQGQNNQVVMYHVASGRSRLAHS